MHIGPLLLQQPDCLSMPPARTSARIPAAVGFTSNGTAMFGISFSSGFGSRQIVPHFRYCTAGHRPQIQACHAAIGAEAAAVFFKQPAVDPSMVVNHPQPALAGKIIITENIGALQAKQQDHLRRPDADALQRAQLPDRIRIGHACNGVQVKLPRSDFFGKVRLYSALRKVMPSDCGTGTPAAQLVSEFTSPSASCSRCQIVACALVETCRPMIWWTTDENRSVSTAR